MHLYFLVIGIVLFPQAHALKCHVCPSDSTSCTQKQCPPEMNQCGALRLISYNGNVKTSDIKSRSCSSAQQCIKGSMNFGVEKKVVTSECCTSELCNKNNAPDPPKPKPNGKKCYRCDGKSDCTGTLNCEGDEDRCVKAIVVTSEGNKTLKGCATKSMCSVSSFPGFSTVTCCDGNHCNGADGASASLLLLATMLISNVFFSN